MAILSIIDDAMVGGEEFFSRGTEIADPIEKRAAGQARGALELSGGCRRGRQKARRPSCRTPNWPVGLRAAPCATVR